MGAGVFRAGVLCRLDTDGGAALKKLADYLVRRSEGCKMTLEWLIRTEVGRNRNGYFADVIERRCSERENISPERVAARDKMAAVDTD